MKVYISGKITGLDIDVAREKFQVDEDHLHSLGYEVVNPIKITGQDGETWRECMSECLDELLYCDAILMQPDWGESRGARLEYVMARELDLKILFSSKMNSVAS